MDDAYAERPLAGWYMIAAAASLLFMVLLVVGASIRLTIDPMTLPLDERAQFEAEPLWMVVVFGLAALCGAAGGALLILRRRAAEQLLLISWIGIGLWVTGSFVNGGVRDLLSTGQIAAAFAVLAAAWTIYWFARHSRQRGWLR